jgi:predicted nucleotidyltransferase
MRIDSTATIAGHPALRVRELLRRGRVGEWGTEFVRRALKVDHDEAARVLVLLYEKGLLEPGMVDRGEQLYRPTLLGRAFAGASAGKPIKRATADRLLSEFLGRVEQVNADAYYLFRVARVVVFGSYLSDAETLSDLDLAIHLDAKESDWDKHVALEDADQRSSRRGSQFPE